MTDLLLQCLSPQDFTWLTTTGKSLTLQKGQTLETKRSDEQTVYFVLAGKLSASPYPLEHSARSTIAHTLTQLSAGHVIGRLSQQIPESTTIQALETTQLLSIPWELLQQKLKTDPYFAAHLYQAAALLLAQRLQSVTYSALQAPAQRESVTVFSGLNDSDLAWLMTVGQIECIKQNQVFSHPGKPLDRLSIILDGAFVLHHVNDDRSPLMQSLSHSETIPDDAIGAEFARLSKGDWIGDRMFVNAAPTHTRISAVRDTQLLSIPKWRLSAKLIHDVEFASRFYHVVWLLLSRQYDLILQQFRQDFRQDETPEESDDLSERQFLDQVPLAEANFEWMLNQIQTQLGIGRTIQWQS
jgi:CRP-like cAMP-binding protein